jgi:large subunit ribosomal protein L6e
MTPAQKKAISPERVAAQKAVDDAVVAAVRKDPLLARYLKVKFSLSKGQYPHEMKF